MEEKRPVGRPKIADEDKRKPRIALKLSDSEFEEIKAAAGGNVNGWARAVLLRAARRVK